MKFSFTKLAAKLGVGSALTATALLAASPAAARDPYDHHYDRGNDAAIAIGAGVIGLAIGAAIADRGDDHYYDRRYYDTRRYVTVRGRPGYYYYYQGNPNRYYRDRYYSRYYAPYYRDRWNNRRDWRYNNYDRRSDRRYDRYDNRRDHRQYRRDDRRSDRHHR